MSMKVEDVRIFKTSQFRTINHAAQPATKNIF